MTDEPGSSSWKVLRATIVGIILVELVLLSTGWDLPWYLRVLVLWIPATVLATWLTGTPLGTAFRSERTRRGSAASAAEEFERRFPPTRHGR